MARVVVYGRESCGYTARAMALLREQDIDFDYIEVGDDREKKAEMTRRARGRTTTPQIFVDGRHVGGADDLERVAEAGHL